KHEKAKGTGDEKLAKQLEAEGRSRQEQIHRQVFGTAPVNDALEKIKKDIPKVARSTGVDVIVSVHDVVYQSPSAKFVDITDQIVELFDPDEKTLEKIEAIRKYPQVDDTFEFECDRHN
ncbi:MAG: OmpH/Skp family outer membrane protein, partial [Planctomycetota bacterium]